MSGGPIVVGWDGSERARDAVALARVIARSRGARLALVHAFYLWPGADPLPAEYGEDLRTASEEEAARIPRELVAGVEWEAQVMPGPSAAHALNDFAEREHAQLVVLGSTHRGPLGKVLPGTTASRFLQGAPCPVAIAPAGFAGDNEERIRLIEVAFDGTPESHAALRVAVGWAGTAGAQLRIVSVVEPQAYAVFGSGVMTLPDLVDTRRDYLREQVDAAVADELPVGSDVDVRLVDGMPAKALVAEAGDADLLVIGSRGYGPVRRVLLGSTSSEVVREAPCPVLVVPRSVVTATERIDMETAASA